MRKFEKIDFEQFKNEICDDKQLYDDYKLPQRKTKYSAGYDINSLIDFELKPNEMIKIPTGIKAYMNDDEVLMIFVRSSQGFKYNVRCCNQVGIIDKDYMNHIWIKLQNEGDQIYKVQKGDAIAQGIFTKYLIVDDEETIEKIREGGFGSTNGK